MVNRKMQKLGSERSVIREAFEYGKKRKAEIGDENVFDFTLGNPSIEPPEQVKQELLRLINESNPTALHGYTSAQGDKNVRESIAKYIKGAFGFAADPELIYISTGAAGALSATLSGILCEGDEVVVLAPYFPEYKVFIENEGGKTVSVACKREDLMPDIDAVSSAITERTKAIIINSPNNPTGVVYSGECIMRLSQMLKVRSAEIGHPILIIADEPYRELAYSATVPYIPNYYSDTVVIYSFSKSLSLPGERIGYVLVSPECSFCNEIYQAICGASRALGYVCAPSLFQKMIPNCLGLTADVEKYRENRDLLCSSLSSYGFEMIRPDGAFYILIKAPNGNSEELCERARKHEILLVPTDSFCLRGYARLAYCVDYGTCERSLPKFKELAESYGL